MLRYVHSLPGLIAGVLVAILAATGAILSVIPALERAGTTVPASGQVSVADLAETVTARYPGVERIVRKPSGAIVVYYFDADVPGANVIDPLTGASIAPYAPSGFVRTVTNLHRAFLLGDIGRGAAGIGALAMLVLSATGLMMLAARLGGWRRLLQPIRGTGIKRLHAEIGRLAVTGLLLSALTGLYMSLATFGFIPDGMDAEPPFPSVVAGTAPMAIGSIPPLQTVDLVDLRELKFPYAGDLTDVFTLITAKGTGYIDQATGEMLSYMPNGILRQIYETIFMLHTGQGLWWLALVLGLAALSVPVFTVTGALIWWKRRSAMPSIAHNAGPQAADTVILVGSEGNSTWGFARTLHNAFTQAGHHVHTAPMNQLAPAYQNAKRMFILTATYGDGAAPASANQFLSRLAAIEAVPGFSVAVLGFGDRQFPRFCQYARDVEEALALKGWPLLRSMDTIDRQSSQEFARWGEAISEPTGTKLTLVHTADRPRTVPLTLIERLDYGDDVQAPTSILRFVAAGQTSRSLWQRLWGSSLPRFEAGDLVGILPPGSNLPRFYSLGSRSKSGVLEICVRKQAGGLCSSFLHGLQPGDSIDAFIRPNPAFRPVKGKAPLILIGAGTGIGPLAGFIRNNAKRRPIHLYFGARDPHSDFLYAQDLRDWVGDRRLTGITTAFSRTTDRAYVQDKVATDAEYIRLLISRGAQIMVCGGRDMAQGVLAAVENIIRPLGLDIATLKERGLYVEDVY